LVEAGFDLVVGTHSHVLGSTELYDGKLIVYSLGNVVARAFRLETAVGALLEVTLVENGGKVSLAGFGFRPTQIRSPGHVITPVDSARAADTAAWRVAARVLGPTLLQWNGAPEGP
jgi:hypothetical protein